MECTITVVACQAIIRTADAITGFLDTVLTPLARVLEGALRVMDGVWQVWEFSIGDKCFPKVCRQLAKVELGKEKFL